MRSSPHLSRRSFLIGTAALAVLAACGDESTSAGSDGTTTTSPVPEGAALALGTFFDPNGFVVAGRPQRLPFGIFVDGFPGTFDNTPGAVELRFGLGDTDLASADPISAERRGQGSMPRPYFPVTHTFGEPGLWTVATTINGETLTSTFEVIDPADAKVLGPGDDMPLVATPTFDDAAGVDPICTNDPQCPLHSVTLADALDTNSPVVLLVSTPQFCQTSVCGPVLDHVLAAADQRDGIQFLHAEVFVDPNVESPTPAPIMGELGLTYEPSLFLVDAGGTIVDRLDIVFDADELGDALDLLTV